MYVNKKKTVKLETVYNHTFSCTKLKMSWLRHTKRTDIFTNKATSNTPVITFLIAEIFFPTTFSIYQRACSLL